jgi:hypothetical protein
MDAEVQGMTRVCGEFAMTGPTSESDGRSEVEVPADQDPKTGPGRLCPSNGVLSIPIAASNAFNDRPPLCASRQHGRRREGRRNYARGYHLVCALGFEHVD